MELDLTRITWPVVVAALLVVAIGFGLLGAAVTPLDAQGEPVLLTAQRWTAARLARQANAETEALVKDAAERERGRQSTLNNLNRIVIKSLMPGLSPIPLPLL